MVSANANAPCQPERNAIFSDFQPVAAPNGNGNGNGNGKGKKNKNNNRQAANNPQFMVPITDTQPIYIYCSQAQHCQQGMVMVINPPNANAVQQFQQKAAKAKNNVSPRGGISGGSVQNNAAGTNPKNVVGANQGDAAPNAQKNGNGKAGKAGKGGKKGKGN